LAAFGKEQVQVHCGGIERRHYQGDTGVAYRA
jgi:hypothetical protein